MIKVINPRSRIPPPKPSGVNPATTARAREFDFIQFAITNYTHRRDRNYHYAVPPSNILLINARDVYKNSLSRVVRNYPLISLSPIPSEITIVARAALVNNDKRSGKKGGVKKAPL